MQQDMVTFRETAKKHLGAKLIHAKLEEVGIPDTPEYIPYADNDQNQNETTFPKRTHLKLVMSVCIHQLCFHVEVR